MQRKSQQIESEIDEAQRKKEKRKKKTLKMRIPLFSPTSRVKYFLISFFLPFSWFPPKVNHIQQHLSNSNIHFLSLLPSLSQTNIHHCGTHMVFGPSWETVFTKDPVASHHENIYSTTYTGIMTTMRKRKTNKQTNRIWGTFVYMNVLSQSMRTPNTQQTK